LKTFDSPEVVLVVGEKWLVLLHGKGGDEDVGIW
jgi:hypothetical protein